MVDRVYRSDLPQLREGLERLRIEFSKLDTTTHWPELRLAALIRHAQQLERDLKSHGSSRLRKGVPMFHSDLVYLRSNLKGLSDLLRSEQGAAKRRIRRRPG